MIINAWKEEYNPLYSTIQPDRLDEDLMEEKMKEGLEYVIVGGQMLNSYR